MVTDIDKEETKRRRKEHQLAVEQGKAQKVVKPLPPGYTCKACGAVEQHAIYNCPLKQTSKVKATVSRSPEDRRENTDDFGRGGDGEKELTEAKQVYISGLPYDMNVAKLLSILKENGCEGVKQPFGVHLMTFADNPQKCKGVAFVTFVNAASAKSSIEKLSGLCLNESKPHLRLGCELNTRKQAQEWKPPSEARVSLNFSGNDHSGTGKKRKKLGKGNTKCCYRCGGLCQDPSKCTAERICYKCKGTGHLSSHCPLRKNPNLPSSTSSIISSENKKMIFDDND